MKVFYKFFLNTVTLQKVQLATSHLFFFFKATSLTAANDIYPLSGSLIFKDGINIGHAVFYVRHDMVGYQKYSRLRL